ncbi:MAG: hypothetical protein Q9171_005298 [Xanthocarpia ochracea]
MPYSHSTWPVFLKAPAPCTEKVHTSAFPFLRLPAELRNQIYSCLLPTTVRISPVRPNYEKIVRTWSTASVCRQLRYEFLSRLYSTATFHVYTTATLRLQLRSLKEAYEAWFEQLDEELGSLLGQVVFGQDMEVRRKGRGMKGWRPDLKADEYMYSSGPPIPDWRETAVKDEIGNWEILWRDSKPPDTKRKRILRIVKAIDSQQSTNSQAATTGLGKEGIRRLVAAYNDTEVKAAAGPEEITSWRDHLYGARFGRVCGFL